MNEKKYYVVYQEIEEKRECIYLHDIVDVIEELYIVHSDVCLSEFLNFISIEGASIQETVDIFATIMSLQKEDILLQIYNTDDCDCDGMLNYLKENGIEFCERGI